MAEDKTVAQNRKARHEYFIIDSFETGIVLSGTEIKSVRDGRVNLKDGFASVEGGELWLYNVHISPYEKGTIYNKDPLRPRAAQDVPQRGQMGENRACRGEGQAAP